MKMFSNVTLTYFLSLALLSMAATIPVHAFVQQPLILLREDGNLAADARCMRPFNSLEVGEHGESCLRIRLLGPKSHDFGCEIAQDALTKAEPAFRPRALHGDGGSAVNRRKSGGKSPAPGYAGTLPRSGFLFG